MSIDRRTLLLAGGSCATLLAAGGAAYASQGVVEIVMAGNSNGSRVWYEPVGLLVQSGQRVRWTNRDTGNAHTATAYHPLNFDRVRRMPEGAAAWNSGFLLPGEAFEWLLTEPGVYDYYCVPHEHAGMVGRIVVDGAPDQGWLKEESQGEDLPEIARDAFPAVAEILEKGSITRR